MEQVKTTGTETLLQDVFRNVKMATDAILDVMPAVKDESMKSELTVEISTYEAFASRTAKELESNKIKPEEENAIKKWGAKMGIWMNTVKDSSTDHIAQMMIEGTTMGVTDLLRSVKDSPDATAEATRIARDVTSYMESCIEKMKAFI